MHRSLDEFEIQSDPTMCFTRPRYQVSVYRTIGPLVLVFDQIFFILAGNENIHNISDEFEIRPDRTKDCRVSCP